MSTPIVTRGDDALTFTTSPTDVMRFLAGGDTSVANPPPGATPPPGAKTDKKSGCGCDTDGRGGATALAGGLGVAALLVRRRRR